MTGIADWLALPTPLSRWRTRARQVIRGVVFEHPNLDTIDKPALLALVDDAYPFGERAMQPYKAWLTERRLFIDAIADKSTSATISADEGIACDVARDFVEEGKLEAAQKLLDDQAPNRLKRKCPACSRPVDQLCRDFDKREDMLVPHASRLEVNGPLFGPRVEARR